MSEVSIEAAGAISIALIVGLGIFVYPWVLRRRYGIGIVALITVLLAVMFAAFQGLQSSTASLIAAAAWSFGPVIAGVIVYRLQRKGE